MLHTGFRLKQEASLLAWRPNGRGRYEQDTKFLPHLLKEDRNGQSFQTPCHRQDEAG